LREEVDMSTLTTDIYDRTFDLSEDGSKIQVGGVVYIYSDNLWREEVGWPTMTTGGLAFECREARRAGKIVEILNIAGEGEEE
jgi:hypothetical protein